MKRAYLLAAVAVATIASSANAVQTITITGPSGFFGDDSVQAGTSSISTIGFPGVQTGTGLGTFGGAGTFTRTFNFITPTGYNLSNVTAQNIASSSLTNIDFTSVTLNGVAFAISNGTLDQASLFNQTLITGANNVLTITGLTGGDAALSGNLSFAAAAVPEPAAWAMMIGGFGLVGFSLRRRTNTKVAFA